MYGHRTQNEEQKPFNHVNAITHRKLCLDTPEVKNKRTIVSYCMSFLYYFQTKPVAYLSMAVAYVTALYTYLYQVIDNDNTRADILGGTSSSITTFLLCLPAIELVHSPTIVALNVPTLKTEISVKITRGKYILPFLL